MNKLEHSLSQIKEENEQNIMKGKKLRNELEEKQKNSLNHCEELRKIIEDRDNQIETLQNQMEQLKKRSKKEIDAIRNEKNELLTKYEQSKYIINISYKNGNEFKGILKYLTDKKGGNIHDNGTIEITSNSICGSRHPKNLLDQNDNNYVPKMYEKDFWVCFDFKCMEVEVMHYSIKSYNNGPGVGHIKNWMIEISNDAQNWIKIDEHINSSELNGKCIIKTFEVQPKKFSRFIRFHHFGDYWGINDSCYLNLCSIEFYGFLREL